MTKIQDFIDRCRKMPNRSGNRDDGLDPWDLAIIKLAEIMAQATQAEGNKVAAISELVSKFAELANDAKAEADSARYKGKTLDGVDMSIWWAHYNDGRAIAYENAAKALCEVLK